MSYNRFKKPPLDSRQLLAFATVARTLSFTLAGKELYVTQSAVSYAVKGLEEELGCRLLDRDGKKLRVTPAGEHLLHYAEKVLSVMGEARAALDQRERWQTNGLRIAANESFCCCVLPGILKSFRRQFPDWPVSVKNGDTKECVEWLDHNMIDVAIAIAPSRAEPVEVFPLFSDELMWIVAPNHPWAQLGIAEAEDIAAETFICTSTTSYTSCLLRSHLERDGVRMKGELEVASLGAVKEMVKDNAGVTALATWNVREELHNGTLVALPLGKKKLKRNWSLLRPLDRKPGLVSEIFVKFAMEATSVVASAASVAACIVAALPLRSGG